MRHSMTNLVLIIVFGSFLISCADIPNSPYPEEDLRAEYFYTSFTTPPKTLDPAVSYSSNEANIIGSMYEPPFMYHPYKRPYILIPNSVREMPMPEYSKQVFVVDKAKTLPVGELVNKVQNTKLNELKASILEYLKSNLNNEKVATAKIKVLTKQLMNMQEKSSNEFKSSTYMKKIVDNIYINVRKMAQSIVLKAEKLTNSQLSTKVSEIFTNTLAVKVFKSSLNEKKLLSHVTEEAKNYWTENGWNANKVISIEGNVLQSEKYRKTVEIKSIVNKQYENTATDFIALDAKTEIPEGAEILGLTNQYEVAVLSEFTKKEDLATLGLTDANLKYYTIANKMAFNKTYKELLTKNLVKEEKSAENTEENAPEVEALGFINNQIMIKVDENIKIDFDLLQNDGMILSLMHFNEIEKIADDKDIAVSFIVWLPSSESECRDLYQNRKATAGTADMRNFGTIRSFKDKLEYPYVWNTGYVHSIYTMRIMPGIYYQPHPCFSRDKKSGEFLFHEGKKTFINTVTQDDGSKRYFIYQNGERVEISKEIKDKLEGKPIDAANLSSVYDLDDFADYFPEYDPATSTRELTAADYVYQIKRMLNPQETAQIAGSLLAPYVENTVPYYRNLMSKIIAERKTRRAEKGITYSQEVDEEENPIKLNFDMDRFDGARVVDKYTYQIVLIQPYPQFKYWMAMPFFAPIPWEADMFFLQGAMQKNTLTLSKFPVATGAYRMWKYQRQSEISSIRNENFNRLGPNEGKEPPVFKATENGSNLLISSMPMGVSESYKTPGTGVDKDKNKKLDGSKDIRDYLVKNNFKEMPFFDENGNGIYDGIRYWDNEERFARIDYAGNFIDFNENGVFDNTDRKVNFAEGIYFEDLNLNGIYDANINELWYQFPATYRTVFPYAGEENSCPDSHIDALVKMQKEAQKLWIEVDKGNNKERLYELDKKINIEFVRVVEEYNYTQEQIGDIASGNLRDSGRRLPFLKALIRRREKEPTSFWSKFMQGYYELSNIGEDKFDKVVDMAESGAYLSEELKSKGIRLNTMVATSIGYMAFNMQNPKWGWAENYDDEQPDLKKAMLRQAIAIALDFEEYNDTFTNGRNIACHMALPPGIYGYEPPESQTFIDNIDDLEYYYNEKIREDENDKRKTVGEMTQTELATWGEKYSIIFAKFSELTKDEKEIALKQKYERNKQEYKKQGVKPADIKIGDDELLAEVHFGLNWVSYTWNKKTNSAERRSITYAKKLLEKGGYPGGKDKTGNQLTLGFLTSGTDPQYLDIIEWRKRQLDEIGVKYDVNQVDYNKFQEMARSGGYQMLEWGWNADYPDPENFFFLLQGKSTKSASNYLKKMSQGGGENAANYWSEDYDKLFTQMSTMSDTPERLKIIRKMNQLLRRDMPWIYSNLNVYYTLYHDWYKNSKTNLMGNNSYWFRRIEPDLRAEYRIDNNHANWWPIVLFFLLVAAALVPGILSKARKETQKTGKID